MTRTEHGADAERARVRALARWEWEGGATGDRTGDRKGAGEASDEADLQILTRLGGAVLDEWNTLPTGVQRAIFQRAASIDATGNGARLKSQIANFLHSHKDREH
jgi:hypothetical protein